MKLPKKIRFWLFKLKAHNIKQKIIVVALISAFWISIVAAVIIWKVPDKINGGNAVTTTTESVDSVVINEATPSFQVLLFKDENQLQDLPKQVNTKDDLDRLITASQNSDLNIDNDLDQINY